MSREFEKKSPIWGASQHSFADYRAAGRFSAPREETLLLFPPRHSKHSWRASGQEGPRGIGSGCEAHSARTRHNTTCIKQGYKTSAGRQADACRFLLIPAYEPESLHSSAASVRNRTHSVCCGPVRLQYERAAKGILLVFIQGCCMFLKIRCWGRRLVRGWILQFTSGTGAKTTTERCRYLRTSRMRQIQGQHMWLRVVLYRVCRVCVDRCTDNVCVSLPFLPPSPFPLLIPHPLPPCSLLLPPAPPPSLSLSLRALVCMNVVRMYGHVHREHELTHKRLCFYILTYTVTYIHTLCGCVCVSMVPGMT